MTTRCCWPTSEQESAVMTSRGARLGVVGVSEPENVARELDDRVLEAASGTDEGNSPFPRVADRRERAVHAAVRTRRCDPDCKSTRLNSRHTVLSYVVFCSHTKKH